MHTRYQDRAAGSQVFGTTGRTCLQGIRSGLQDLTGSELQLVLDRTYLRGISSGLQDLTESGHQIEHVCEVSGWGCRITWTGNTRSNMPTRYKVGAAGSHRLGTPDRTCRRYTRKALQDLMGSGHQIEHACEVSGWGCRISRIRTNIFNMPTRTGLQDLTGLEHQIEHAYEVSCRTAGSHRLRTANRTCLRGIRTGLQDLTCFEQQIKHAYEVLRVGLQDLTGLEQQIQHACEVSWRGCKITRVRNIRSFMPKSYLGRLHNPTGKEQQFQDAYRYQDGAAGSHE